MLKIQPYKHQTELDAQLEEEAFVLYTGISTTEAHLICIDSNGMVSFKDEFWKPFQRWQNSPSRGDIKIRS